MNILLLTDVPPCDNYTAGIVQKHLCEVLLENGHNIYCFYILDPLLAPNIPSYLKEKVCFMKVDKPRENYGRGRLGRVASLVGNNYNAYFELPIIKKKICAFSRTNNIGKIWSVVQGQTMIKLVRKVAVELDIPYSVEVWDPPEWWLAENEFDSYTSKSVMKEFGRLLKHSQCCMAASNEMAKVYAEKYECNAMPVIPSLSEDICLESRFRENETDFVIGFAGQMYARNEFANFIQALDQIKWKHGKKNIKIVLYGEYFDLRLSKPANVVLRGWVDQEQVLNELSCMDLLYCPYWFSEDFELVAKLSFPSKLTTYLKTKVPVFIHAPKYASTSNFIEDNFDGFICNDTTIEDIALKIKSIINLSFSQRREIGNNGHRKYEQYLTRKQMGINFLKALELDE